MFVLFELEELISMQRYLAGSQLTEADIRIFVKLIRFDSVYYFVKCNRKRIASGECIENNNRLVYKRNLAE